MVKKVKQNTSKYILRNQKRTYQTTDIGMKPVSQANDINKIVRETHCVFIRARNSKN